jgi:chromosome segregation ATPase
VSESHRRIQAGTERLRVLRERLEPLPQAFDELTRRAQSASAELAQARAQGAADREAVIQLEATLAERDALRSSMRDRLAELGRMLGS